MTNNDEESWKQLVSAARKVGAGKPAARQSLVAPASFVAHMRSVRKTLWAFARTVLWRRWSLVAIAVAVLLYLIAYLVLKPEPTLSIPPPEPPHPLSP